MSPEPDAFALSLLCRRARLEHVYNATMTPEDLRGVRTLVVVVGSSLKGLAEAGLDERRRVGPRRGAAGGRPTGRSPPRSACTSAENRDGAPSRTGSSNLVLGRVDVLVISQAGNKDGIFTQASRRYAIPLISVAQPAEVARELKARFLSQDRRP